MAPQVTWDQELEVGMGGLLDERNLKPGDVSDEIFHTSAWVNPRGDFYVVAGYGHADAARIICERKGWDYGTYPSDKLEGMGWLHLWYDGTWWLDRQRRLTADQFYVLQVLYHQVQNHHYRRNLWKAMKEYGGEMAEGLNERNWAGGDE